jgi:hypothetical protein
VERSAPDDESGQDSGRKARCQAQAGQKTVARHWLQNSTPEIGGVRRIGQRLRAALDVGKSSLGKSAAFAVLAAWRDAFRLDRCLEVDSAVLLLDGRQVTYKTNTSSVSINRT